jgi:hypothetical protein
MQSATGLPSTSTAMPVTVPVDEDCVVAGAASAATAPMSKTDKNGMQ